MRMSGSFDSDTELEPRMRMREPVPLVPLVWVTVTLAARDESKSFTPLVITVGSESTVSAAMLFPVSRWRSDAPVALTVTWSRRVIVAASAKSSVASCPATERRAVQRRGVAEAQHADAHAPGVHSRQAILPCLIGARVALRADDADDRVADRCAGRTVRHAPGDRPRPLRRQRRPTEHERETGVLQLTKRVMHEPSAC